MEEKIWIQIGSKKFHLIKTIGALVIIGSALMLLSHIYSIFSVASLLLGPGGRTVTLSSGLIQYSGTVDGLSSSAMVAMVLGPLAGAVFWSAALVLGTFIYRTGGFVLPITEWVKKVKEESKSSSKSNNSDSRERKRYLAARGKYICDVCGEEFDSERGMKIHRSLVHD